MENEHKQEELDISGPSCLHLLSAFHAMEPPDVLISFSRDMGGGSIQERVQSFIWKHCISQEVGDKGCHGPYLKKFLKKLIAEIESQGHVVLDELYEQYAFYMTSLKDDDVAKGNSRVVKRVSFLFPEECSGLSSCPKSKELEISLQCSLNMLEGDTGCSIWPSSLFLSEFILSFPEIFSNKSCFEVGSGVGLVGICLAHVKASAITLSDGDLSTLANMKLNLDTYLLSTSTDLTEHNKYPSKVQCIHLPWESATEFDLQNFAPDIVLGADVIYDPSCLPYLVRVLTALLKGATNRSNYSSVGSHPDCRCVGPISDGCRFNTCHGKAGSFGSSCAEYSSCASEKEPVAYIASVIRNIDTFNYFLELTEQAKLIVSDITEEVKPYNFLSYLKSYPQSSIRVFRISAEL